MKLKSDLKVSIDAEALERVWHWTHLAKGEFSCLALVTDDLIVHGVELFDQTCTTASTELDQQALARFLVHHPQPEKVRCWIHSHGSLNVFWSQQDDTCIEGLENDSVLVSIVVNKRKDIRCRVDLWQPTRLTIDEVPLQVRVPRMDIRAECEAAFRRHVTEVQAPLVAMQPQRLPHDLGSRLVDQRWLGWDDDDFPGWRGQ